VLIEQNDAMLDPPRMAGDYRPAGPNIALLTIGDDANPKKSKD
jgi:hypothetical protein